MPASGRPEMRAVHVEGPKLLPPRSAGKTMAWLAASALAIVLLGQFTDIDVQLADAVFDATSGRFPWQHAWLTEQFNHRIVKGLLMLAGAGFMGGALLDVFRPLARLGALGRLRLRVVALSAVCVPLVISALKQISASHCPWDLERYGGAHPYFRLLDALPPGIVPGHCLPAGHASSALWLVSLAVYWLPDQPGKARVMALSGALVGGLVGFLQQLRGAHFMTHTLWSVWISGAVVLFLIFGLQRLAVPKSLACAQNTCPSR